MKQNGRSMVEMLGVLAIIGVLSIGGIAGYTTAMNYYKGNEILDSVNKAAVQLSAQILTGEALGTEYTLDESITGTDRVLVAYPDGTGAFGIQVQEVEQAVCENILNRDWGLPLEITVNGGKGCGAEDNDIDFVFANDLGDEVIVSNTVLCNPNNPDMYKECTNEFDSVVSDECPSGVCYYGRCIALQGETCTTDLDCTDEKTPYCSSYFKKCVQCTQNSHCGDGYYCGYSNDSCEESSANTCMKTKDPEKTYKASDGYTYYLSDKMSWWDVKNYCESLGKSWVPASAFNTAVPDEGGDGYYDSSSDTDTGLAAELSGSDALNGVWIWLSSLHESCWAYFVNLSDGYIGTSWSGSHYGGKRALCR